VDTARRALESAQQQNKYAQLAATLGAAGADETTVTQVLSLRAEIALIVAQTELQSARNVLEDALHAPLSGPELAMRDTAAAAATGANR
jgi:cobalt-zinc-cadmium efflux system outer membrane protein